MEREGRGWTFDGLAKRMTDAGCAMTGSAIFKIEKGEPRRRIVVDELVAFARVFGVGPEELLLPAEVATNRELARLVRAADEAHSAALAAEARHEEARGALRVFVDENPEARRVLERVASEEVADYKAPSGDARDVFRDLYAQERLFQMTGDERYSRQADLVAESLATLRSVERGGQEAGDVERQEAT